MEENAKKKKRTCECAERVNGEKNTEKKRDVIDSACFFY